MATGKVVSWKNGTGRIRDSSGEVYFFGDRALIGLQIQDVQVGMEVEFVPSTNNRGPVARDVRRAGTGKSSPAASVPVGPRKIEMPRMSDSDILGHIPVPVALRNLLSTLTSDRQRHPGLMLDRFLQPCPKQEQQRDVLNLVAGLPGDPPFLDDQNQRRKFNLIALNARLWSRTTEAPLTLHLARASALENAGICLHPIHGFAYLPGTGLKGLARAFAETVWLPTQTNKVTAWQQIERVFGWAPGSDNGKTWKPEGVPDHPRVDNAAAGTIVFHDAWPEKWPALLVDIVNNHHPKYYRGEDAPGDWDSPNPVYFLAVKPGTAFSFALSKRRVDIPDELLNLAQQWLDGGLTDLGCGAKTAAGYGAFKAEKTFPLIASSYRLRASYTLELVTPAYLAGASQVKEDCDLRSATLRGLLRWWWRTMHSGFVDVETLRAMEAAVWGDTHAGGAVQVRVIRLGGEAIPSPYKAVKEGKLGFNLAFGNQHHIQGKGLTGLAYAGYGMDEMAAPGPGQPPQRRQRWCMQPGAKWRVELTARPGRFTCRDNQGKVIREQSLPDAALLLDQAKTALWWFCTLGGAGSKSRKGFGSFAMPSDLEAFPGATWLAQGKGFRKACGLPEDDFREESVISASLRLMRRLSIAVLGDGLPWIQVTTSWDDPWQVLDLIGRAMMACAQSVEPHGKHREAKRGLGLPRKIHGPGNSPMRHQDPKSFQRPIQLDGIRGDRHGSPVLFHVARRQRSLDVHVAAFPTADLREPGMQAIPGLEAHKQFLQEYLTHLQDELRRHQ